MQLDTIVYRSVRMTAPCPAFEGVKALKYADVSARQLIEVTMNEHVQTALTEPLFNPLAPEFIRDPYPHYERLRTTDPMHQSPLGMVASRLASACRLHARGILFEFQKQGRVDHRHARGSRRAVDPALSRVAG